MTLVYTSTKNEWVVCQLPFRITLQIYMICFTIGTVFDTLLSCRKTSSIKYSYFYCCRAPKLPLWPNSLLLLIDYHLGLYATWLPKFQTPTVTDSQTSLWLDFHSVIVTFLQLKISRFIIAELLLLRYCRYLI